MALKRVRIFLASFSMLVDVTFKVEMEKTKVSFLLRLVQLLR